MCLQGQLGHSCPLVSQCQHQNTLWPRCTPGIATPRVCPSPFSVWDSETAGVWEGRSLKTLKEQRRLTVRTDGWVLRRLWKKWILKGSVRVCGDRGPYSISSYQPSHWMRHSYSGQKTWGQYSLVKSFVCYPFSFLVESQIIAEKHKQSLQSQKFFLWVSFSISSCYS